MDGKNKEIIYREKSSYALQDKRREARKVQTKKCKRKSEERKRGRGGHENQEERLELEIIVFLYDLKVKHR